VLYFLFLTFFLDSFPTHLWYTRALPQDEWFIEFKEKSHRVSEHGVIPGWFYTRSSLNGFCMMYISPKIALLLIAC
jgi:hypothetical protein